MAQWNDIRITMSDAAHREGWANQHYQFLRSRMLPALDQLGVNRILVMHYFSPGKYDYIRLFVCTEPEEWAKVEHSLTRFQEEQIILGYQFEAWDPEAYAKERVARAHRSAMASGRLGQDLPAKGWSVVGRKKDGGWTVVPTDQDEKIKVLAEMVSDVVGQCTRAFYSHIQERPDDRWLTAIFIHLLLNSLCFETYAEEEIRSLPLG
ncbi:MAG: hypothetical protein HY680_00035 [Chloroflexi bacterium]|nr:hypothetical protein [Chloroflexota bacterium]